MNLTDQTVSEINEIYLNDSINASLLKLEVKMTADTVIPNGNDLIIYVDKNTSSNPTSERKQYVFELSSPLKYFNQVGDKLVEQISIKNNEVTLKTTVSRYVGTNENGNYVLNETIKEIIESIPITLFEGVNYIYTNYSNAIITVIYPKDNELNRSFLNNVIYAENNINNSSGFNLNDLYFKDAFTKTNNKLNIEVNNATIDCLTSKNNNFSLDAEGNLVVNSITSNQQTNLNEIRDYIYPIGSIYMSTSNINPSTVIGGTWEQLKNRFLVGAGDSYSVNTTGGSTSVTSGQSSGNTGSTVLSINQIPSHRHSLRVVKDLRTDSGGSLPKANNSIGDNSGWSAAVDVNHSNNALGYTGGNQGHTHSLNSHTHIVSTIPPYLAVYMWKRTA